MEVNPKPLFLKLWLIAVIASMGVFAFQTKLFTGSFSLGCAAMILNLYGLFSILNKIFHSDMVQASIYTALLMFKFLILAVAIYMLSRYAHIHLMAFGLGFFIIAISATYVTGSLQNQSKDS